MVQRQLDEMEAAIARYQSQWDQINKNPDLTPQGRTRQVDALRAGLQQYAEQVIPDIWGNVIDTTGDEQSQGAFTLDPNGRMWRESAARNAALQDAINKAEMAAMDASAISWGTARARSLVADAKSNARGNSLGTPDDREIADAIMRSYATAPEAVKIAMQDLAGDIISGESGAMKDLRRKLATDREKRVITPAVKSAQKQAQDLFAQMERGLDLTNRLYSLIRYPGIGFSAVRRIVDGIARYIEPARDADGNLMTKTTIDRRIWGPVRDRTAWIASGQDSEE